MASHAHNDKLLIHFFQDSLTGAASSWYTQLERTHIRSWKDLADAFLKQYKYNLEVAPDRSQLQNMAKGEEESFKEYAQRWRELAAQVQPPLSEKEMVGMFIDTLQDPFYEMLIGAVSASFVDVVIVGERVEEGIRSGKIAFEDIGAINAKRSLAWPGEKKEGVTYNLNLDQNQHPPRYSIPNLPNFQPPFPSPYIATASHNPYPPRYPPPMQSLPPMPFPVQTHAIPNPNTNHIENQRKPNTLERKPVQFDPIPMTYTELLPRLIQSSMVVPCPAKPVEPPYPKWYNPNHKCDYHAGVIGHSIENCLTFKHKVQRMIDAKWLNFEKDTPSAMSNPLPNHENSGR